MTFLLSLFARWGLPEGLRRFAAYATLAVAAVALLWAAKAIYDRSVIREHEADMKRKVEAISSEAAEDAKGAVSETKGEVEAGNEAARKAAEGSADPLRDALRELGK